MIKNNNQKYLSKEILNQIRSSNKISVEYKKSKDNNLIPYYNNTALHSSYYPFKEYEKIKISDNDKEQIIAIGFGAGCHLAEIAKNKKILCIPVNIDLLNDVLSNLEISYMNYDNFKIISAGEILQYFDFYNYLSYSFIVHPVLERLFSGQVLEIIKKVKMILNEPVLEVNTYKKFGRIWFVNILKNIRLIVEKKFSNHPLVLEKKPVLITGAGPSLSININLIKKYKNKFFIAATDTSLKVLIKNNIIPDAVFSFDCQYYSLLHFTDMKNNFRLFTDITSQLKFFNNQTPLFSNHPFLNLLKSFGFKTIELPSDTRNIGGAVIDFFNKYFSDYPIITAGIDYGIRNNYIYSRGSYIDEVCCINSNYFKTSDNINSGLLYRNNINNIKNIWKTNSLLNQYSSSMKKLNQVYTLSDSPYLKQNKISNIDMIIDLAEKNNIAVLNFNYNDLNMNLLKDYLIAEIQKKSELLYSFFISINKKPDLEGIKIVSDILNKYL